MRAALLSLTLILLFTSCSEGIDVIKSTGAKIRKAVVVCTPINGDECEIKLPVDIKKDDDNMHDVNATSPLHGWESKMNLW